VRWLVGHLGLAQRFLAEGIEGRAKIERCADHKARISSSRGAIAGMSAICAGL
jgi:hypothetical protein